MVEPRWDSSLSPCRNLDGLRHQLYDFLAGSGAHNCGAEGPHEANVKIANVETLEPEPFKHRLDSHDESNSRRGYIRPCEVLTKPIVSGRVQQSKLTHGFGRKNKSIPVWRGETRVSRFRPRFAGGVRRWGVAAGQRSKGDGGPRPTLSRPISS